MPEEVPDGLFEEVPEEELSGEDISEEELVSRLAEAGYVYDEEHRCFR